MQALSALFTLFVSTWIAAAGAQDQRSIAACCVPHEGVRATSTIASRLERFTSCGLVPIQ